MKQDKNKSSLDSRFSELAQRSYKSAKLEIIRFKNAYSEKVREEMKNNTYVEHVNANDFHNTKVTVDDLVAFFNNASKFDAKLLKNKDRVAIFDRVTKKKCAEFAYRNKKDSFSCALQCNRFDADTVERVADTVNATYKYHACKNQRDYITVNDVSAESAMSFVFRVFDKLVK